MPEQPILIATLMRPEGDTGVQTHFRTFQHWLGEQALPNLLCTPFEAPRWQVYPVFGLRRAVEIASKPWSVWWYRHWHAHFLKSVLRSQLSRGQPCTVYAQCPLSAEAALAVRTSPEQMVVLVTHFNVSQADEWAGKGMLPPDHRIFRSIRRLEERVLPRVDGLVFVSQFARRELLQRIPAVSAVPSCVLPNFVADPEPPAADVPLMGDLICVGTLEPRKNQRYAIEILSVLAKSGAPRRLTLVGDGPDRAMLENLAAGLGVAHLVTFTGRIPDASSLMARHRAYLHTALIESQGIVLIEAMSRGLPVFAPAVGGIPEVFDDGVEGRQIPLGDAPAAAAILASWLSDPQAMSVASSRGRARFLQAFSTDAVAGRLESFLRKPQGTHD